MKNDFAVFAIALLSIVAAAGRLAAAQPSGLEGEYVDESDGSTLTITADHWKTKSGDFVSDETYTAKKSGDNSYDIVMTLTEEPVKGQKMTATVRKEGSFIFVRLEDSKTEVKWKKK